MTDIVNRKAILIAQFDDGDITFKEFADGIEAIHQAELDLLASKHKKRLMWVAGISAILVLMPYALPIKTKANLADCYLDVAKSTTRDGVSIGIEACEMKYK